MRSPGIINQLISSSYMKHDRKALISTTRAIMHGDHRFAFQDGRQELFDSITSWVYDLVPCFPDQAKSIWRRIIHKFVYKINNYFSNKQLCSFINSRQLLK